jgi:hypothetical protein
MDRARLGEPDAPPAEAALVGEPSATLLGSPAALVAPGDLLADEMRHSALLIGWALGSMGLLAVLLLVVTTRFGG